MQVVRVPLWIVLGLAAACQASGDTPPGAERGACRTGSGAARCDRGLVCLSDLCVRAPPADCAAVAEKLASFELGNYAPREQRAQVVADKQAACVAALVSKAEGECLAKAADRWAAARCAPSLFPGMASSGTSDCDEVIARIMAAMPASAAQQPELAAQLARVRGVMGDSCREDGWPDDLKRCILAAPPGEVTGMQSCNDKMPKALQDKMSARIMDTMQKR